MNKNSIINKNDDDNNNNNNIKDLGSKGPWS